MEGITINIATDFGRDLGGRWKEYGPFSGEEFYNSILENKFLEAQKDNKKLVIQMDGTNGYPSSFLDQSFGELARRHGVNLVSDIIVFESKVFTWVVQYIKDKIWQTTK